MRTGFYESAYGVEIIKDPDSTLDYSIAWLDRLSSGVTISTATWTIPAGLTKVSEQVNGAPVVSNGRTFPIGTVALVRLSGGTIGTRYTCLCRATLSSAEVDEQSIIIDVRPM
jgi:hypothetical protein